MKSERDGEEDDGYFEDQQLLEEVRERQEIVVGEANPIYTKQISKQPTITFKLLELQKPDFVSNFIPFKLNNKEDRATIGQEQFTNYNHLLSFESPFTRYYDAEQLVYQKYHNQALNKFKEIRYYAGFFIPKNLLYDSMKQSSSFLHQICQEYIEKPVKTAKTPRKLKNLLPQHREQQLIFDSNFQSGNLFATFRTNKYSYDLVMQNDTNSKGSNQWFYFSVQKMLQNVQYTFNIVNFTKRDSLFNYGLKPAYYSTVANKRSGEGWFRFGENVSYDKGEINRQNSTRYYYSLRFSITNKYSNDKIFLAHSYPYTYSKLVTFLGDIIKPHNSTQTQGNFNVITKFSIGTTISGRSIDCLKIFENGKKKQHRKAIIILARQHPGQTQGSYVCEGVIKKMIERGTNKKQKQADFIRKNYITYVIPMVNIDGVVFGHYRTNLAGKDLNRKWDSNEREWVCPEVSAIKNFISDVAKENQIRFILDLHGHSKKMGSFFYGNPCQENPENVRIYPYICSRLNAGIQYMDCTFHIDQSKKKAARVYLSLLYRQLHVYTFESSFYGYMKNSKKIEFTPQQYCSLGQTLIQSLYIQLQQDTNNRPIEIQSKLEQLQKKQKNGEAEQNKNESKNQEKLTANVLYMKFFNELKNDDILLGIGNGDQSGSESHPDQGEINETEIILEARKKKMEEGKEEKIKEDPKTCEKVPKSSAIRITNKKQHNTVQYKDLSKPVRNMKFLALSQVNAVLPDKYHISLQPLQRRNPTSKNITVSVECQTQMNEKLPNKIFKFAEITEKDNLTGEFQFIGRRTSHSKKNSEFMTIHKNQVFRSDLATQQPLIRRRERSFRKNTKNIYTQTILSYKNSLYVPTPKTHEKKPLKITTENEARIARMQQINFEVLRVYSRRSAIVDIGIKNRDRQKSLNRASYLSSAKRKDGSHF